MVVTQRVTCIRFGMVRVYLTRKLLNAVLPWSSAGERLIVGRHQQLTLQWIVCLHAVNYKKPSSLLVPTQFFQSSNHGTNSLCGKNVVC